MAVPVLSVLLSGAMIALAPVPQAGPSAPPATAATRLPPRQLAPSEAPSAGNGLRMIPVDQGFVDRSPVSTSLKAVPMESRATPWGFDRLYRIPGDDQHFVRGNGGLYAVFPYSAYAKTKKGTRVVISPSTTFVIGARREWLEVAAQPDGDSAPAPQAIRAHIDGRIQPEPFQSTVRHDKRVAGRAVHDLSPAPSHRALARIEQRPTAPRVAPPLPPIVSSEAYRRAFYAALLGKPT